VRGALTDAEPADAHGEALLPGLSDPADDVAPCGELWRAGAGEAGGLTPLRADHQAEIYTI
jgi:hypothetical protein